MLTPESTVLVFVDVQGKLANIMDDRDDLFNNLQRMLAGATALDIPILVTEQIPEKLSPTREEFSDLIGGARVIPKTAFSCGGEPAFLAALEELARLQVLLVGIETHVCIYQTAMDLTERGYKVQVVADAVSSRSPRNREIALSRMQQEGIRLTSTEMCLMEMVRDAAEPCFRDVLKVIR